MASSILDAALPAVDLESVEAPRNLIKAGVVAIVVLLIALGCWITLAPLGGAAIAPGVVKVDLNRKTVQHQEGGIVGEILVRDGAKVKAGDTLIVLKDVRVNASNELAQTQLDAELAKAARLSAEQGWSDMISFPNELSSRASDPRIAELLQREKHLFQTRRAAYDKQVRLIRSQIAETEAEIKVRNQQLKSDELAIKLHREELAVNQALLQDGFVSKTRLLALERSVAEAEARQGENDAERSRARQKVEELALRAETMRSTFMQEAAGELRQTTGQVFDLRERVRPAQDAEQRQRIVAPISGEVVDMKISTIGAVIAPREPILDIVPENPDLIIEARVRPEDIAFVEKQAKADVRLTSFRQRLTPTVTGKVTYVSADRLVDKDGKMAYYVAHVRVTPQALEQAGGLHLQAGMPAEVFIQTSSRTSLQYLVDPITGFLQRSMRER